MAKRFQVNDEFPLVIKDTRSERDWMVSTSGVATEVCLLLNELWETSFIASQSTTVTKILSAIVTGNKQVLIPFTLHEKMAMIIKVLGGPEKAEEFFSELEDSTTIK